MSPRWAVPTLQSRLVVVLVACLSFCSSLAAQTGGSLDERLNEEDYLKGLADLELPEVLEHFIQTNPPQDDVEAAMYDIALQRARISSATDTAARRDAIEQLLAVREALIESQPTNPRRAIWRTDQSSDLLFLLFPFNAAGITAQFGVSTPDQRAIASRVANEMNRHMVQAEREIDRAILELESTSDFSDNIDLQMRRRRLVENERDRRIPFFRGIGAALFAELASSDEAERNSHINIAIQRLEPLLETLPAELADRAALYLGLAQVEAGNADAASQLFDRVLSGGIVLESDVFAARMGQVRNAATNQTAADALAALQQMRSQYGSADDVLYRVLIADQVFRIESDLATAASGNAAAGHRLRAYRAYLELLNADLGLSPDEAEAIVFNRLAAVAGADAPLDQLPALVTIAVAQRLSADESTRAEGISRFESALARTDLVDGDRAAALFGLGRALYQGGQHLAAAERFTQLATRYPTDRRAESAIELAASIADAAYRDAPNDQSVRATLHETLSLLLDRFSNLPSIDRWRYAAGRLAIAEKNYTRAIQHFNSVAIDAPQRLDGLYMEAAAIRAQLRDQQNARESPAQVRITAGALDESVRRARTALEQGLIEADDATRRDDLRWYLGFLRVYEAEANLALGDATAALNAVAGIEDDAELEGGIIAQALRARIDAFQLLGRTSDAAQEIERFLQTSPDQAGDVVTPLLATIIQDVEDLIAINRDDEARQLAEEKLLPHAGHLERWLQNSTISDGRRRAVTFQLAEALRYGGEHRKALALYDMLLRDRPDALELLTGKAESLFALREEAGLGEAMTIYRRLAGVVNAGSPPFWRAQLRMLQILDAVNRNTDQIAPRIRRLQQQYPQLGGDPWRRQLQALLTKHG